MFLILIFIWTFIALFQNCSNNELIRMRSEDGAKLNNDRTPRTPDKEAPILKIISPTSALSYTTSQSVVTLSGSAIDNVSVESIFCQGGASCAVVGVNPWIATVTLNSNDNLIQIHAKDTSGNISIATITITKDTEVSLASCTKYVSSSGSVNGKSASKTLQAGLDNLVPGDTLCIAAGLYHEVIRASKSGTQEKPIIIRALDPIKRPIIDGEYRYPEGAPTNMNASYYGNTKCYEVWEDPNANLGPLPKQACFKWSSLVSIGGSFLVWDGVNITNSRGNGLHISGSHVEFQNSEISHIRHNGVYIWGKFVTMRENVIYDISNFASYIRWAGQVGWPGGVYMYEGSSDFKFIGNKVYHVWGEGVGASVKGTVQNVIFKNNVVFDTFSTLFYLHDGSNVVLDSNLIYHTGDSKWFGQGGAGPTGCVSISSEWGNTFENVTIKNNFISGCSWLFWFGQFKSESRFSKIQIYNNTLTASNGTIFSTPTSFPALSGFKFVNNLVIASKFGNFTIVPEMEIHHNFWTFEPLSHFKGVGDIINTNTGIANPNYKVASGGDYDVSVLKLTSSSLAIDAGAVLVEVGSDYFGTSRSLGGKLDIGAHELK